MVKQKVLSFQNSTPIEDVSMRHSITRRQFVKTLSLLSVAPSVLYSNNIAKSNVPRIGFLSGAGSLLLENDFTSELQKLGYTDGKNIYIEQRLARPNTTDGIIMAAELAQMDLSLIGAGSLPFASEVKKSNPKLPLVIVTCPGMVSNGFANSLEHPGGIYTGMDELPKGLTAKRLQLLNTAVPNAACIALLSTTPGSGGHEMQVAEAEQAATTLGIKVKPYRATSLQQLEVALNELVKDGMNAMLNFQGALSLANRQLIVNFINKHRLPAIYQQAAFVELGGLMAWAPDLRQQFREAAHYVDKILNGAKPGDLPVKHPDRYFLTLNKKAATILDISFSKELLAQATRVVE